MPTDVVNVFMEDYDYSLPEDSIAQYTLAERDRSRLLICRNDHITEGPFSRITDFLPDDSMLVMNNSRVLHSRFIFRKDTGANIEIFCLEPVSPSKDITEALDARSFCEWRCMVGNAKKWKKGPLSMKMDYIEQPFVLQAFKVSDEAGRCIVRFEWNDHKISWLSVMELCGRVPLPPYIKREPGESDNIRYQTIYANHHGSVAAPTAGLHFTNEVLRSFDEKNIRRAAITLHVGEGTFKPVSSASIEGHLMHSEKISVRRREIEKLISPDIHLVSVGTTSLRTLESIYWLGVKAVMHHTLPDDLLVDQWEPYGDHLKQDVPFLQAMTALLQLMDDRHTDELTAETKLIIIPGYKIRTAGALITNFHQPRSTLLLLVSAFAGPVWRKAYDYALENNFRFLSYGDACLFFRHDK
jgi:S-adenosylmethionine:tRNA ribosyltransferase-isomerase